MSKLVLELKLAEHLVFTKEYNVLKNKKFIR